MTQLAAAPQHCASSSLPRVNFKLHSNSPRWMPSISILRLRNKGPARMRTAGPKIPEPARGKAVV